MFFFPRKWWVLYYIYSEISFFGLLIFMDTVWCGHDVVCHFYQSQSQWTDKFTAVKTAVWANFQNMKGNSEFCGLIKIKNKILFWPVQDEKRKKIKNSSKMGTDNATFVVSPTNNFGERILYQKYRRWRFARQQNTKFLDLCAKSRVFEGQSATNRLRSENIKENYYINCWIRFSSSAL